MEGEDDIGLGKRDRKTGVKKGILKKLRVYDMARNRYNRFKTL